MRLDFDLYDCTGTTNMDAVNIETLTEKDDDCESNGRDGSASDLELTEATSSTGNQLKKKNSKTLAKRAFDFSKDFTYFPIRIFNRKNNSKLFEMNFLIYRYATKCFRVLCITNQKTSKPKNSKKNKKTF